MKKVYTEFKDKIVDNHSDLNSKPVWDADLCGKIKTFTAKQDVKTWLTIEKIESPTHLKKDNNQDSIYKKYKGMEDNKGYLYSDADEFQGKVDFRTAFYINNTKNLAKSTSADPRSWLHILLLRAHAVDMAPK